MQQKLNHSCKAKQALLSLYTRWIIPREGDRRALKMYRSDAILWQRVQQAMVGDAPSL
ncbi:MAG: hypothetical protein HC781_19125 [Leptolyngbyaceae cyanobacterium CSU_1_4]|nr:hypothetical protein [Leptolyngbyaceae cyanobacterium CSU_1_4]